MRAARSAGLAASTALLVVGYLASLSTGALPPPPPWVGAAAGAAAAVAAAAAAAAAAALGDRLLVEVDGEGLHATVLPAYDAAAFPAGRPDGRGAVTVAPTADRGNGAFACSPAGIPAGAWLGAYEGDLLDEAAFWARYGAAGGAADYCMRIDRTWTVDGAGRAADTSAFSPCHINHARAGRGANVVRATRRAARRVDLYAGRDIAAGEELLLDYGRLYWTGREDQEIV